MNLKKEREFLNYIVKDKKKLSAQFYNFIKRKEKLIESFNITYADLLLLNHILTEQEVISYYNEFSHTDYEAVTDITVTNELKKLYQTLKDFDIIPLEFNLKTRTIVITSSQNRTVQEAVRSVELNTDFTNIVYKKSLKVAYLLLKVSLEDKPESLLETFSPMDKVKIIVIDAIESKATDIHIGAYYNANTNSYDYKIYFRIATELEEWTRFALTKEDNARIVTKFVSLSDNGSTQALDTVKGLEDSITDLLGDGQWSARLRASRCKGGYHSVLRLHEVKLTAMGIEQLGFSKRIQAELINIAKKENGATWVTGRTGSGKNTTIYAILDYILNHKRINMVEFSNPIEVLLNCIQKEFKSDQDLLDLITGLKKEDPDIVFVGEIPNKPIALGVKELIDSNVSVMTTTHLDRCWHICQKLFDYYEYDYKNVLSSINAVITQVMFKKLCPYCREKIVEPNVLQFDYMNRLGLTTAYKAHREGCEMCHKGYTRDVFPQAEILPFNDELIATCLRAESPIEMELVLKRYVYANKLNMENDIKILVENGLIDLESVARRGLCE